jgi:hypothetical protein
VRLQSCRDAGGSDHRRGPHPDGGLPGRPLRDPPR